MGNALDYQGAQNGVFCENPLTSEELEQYRAKQFEEDAATLQREWPVKLQLRKREIYR